MESAVLVDLNDQDPPWPKISIVMPSYNQAQYIEESIRCVLLQGYPDVELIIIDGGSTDDTHRIIDKYQEWITYWVSESDRGQSHALNKGFAVATGSIMGWLNSDDLYNINAFWKIAQLFKLHPQKQIVFGDYHVIDSSSNIQARNYAFDFSLGHFVYEGFFLNAQAMFWRKDTQKRFSNFDENLHRTMDYDMILRFAMMEGSSRFYRTDDVLGAFRKHELQKTGGDASKMLREHRYIANKLGFDDKYLAIGKLKRFRFRVRRGFWYLKRGGLRYFLHRTVSRKRI